MTEQDWTGSWMRRVVPDGYALAQVSLVGTSDLLMSSAETDRFGEQYRTFTMLSQKRGKTLDDEKRLAELEWHLRLYYDEAIGPYVPGRNVKELLRSAATKWKKGEEIVRSLIVIEDRLPLLYDGPRDQVELWDAVDEDGKHLFAYTTLVANAGRNAGRVPRCRPSFTGWSLNVEVAYDPEDLDFDFLGLVVERSQKYGLGDGRRIGFGSFAAKIEAGGGSERGVNADATMRRDGRQDRAHTAGVGRVVHPSEG